MYQTYNAKAEWIAKNYPFININSELIFIKKKYLLDGDIFVDDCLMNCVKWLERHPNGIAYMLPYAYNVIPKEMEDHRLIRVKDWEDLSLKITHKLDFVDSCQNYMTISTREDKG